MPAKSSLAASFQRLSTAERVDALAELTDRESLILLHDWAIWARPDQLAPSGAWSTWLILAGRGWGKTRTGAEWVCDEIGSGRRKRMALVARTAADARDVMVEGESGILAVAPPWARPAYEPSKRRLTWPSGAIATIYTGDKPDQLRGPQHDGAWADEVAAWRYPDAWDQLQFGLRLGGDPRAVVTTTPRPIPIVRELLADPSTAVTRGSTYDNRGNLAARFLAKMEARYAGTRLGRQELHAEVLDDTPGALWTLRLIDQHRRTFHPGLVRVVVAIDPAVSDPKEAEIGEVAETGIVVVALGQDGHVYVLDDLSLVEHPAEWGRIAVKAYGDHQADRIVAEVNNGGALVEVLLRSLNAHVSYQPVHASRGKQTRAEPVAALYERGLVHHVGAFSALEDQMAHWVPGQKSPDRMDALVWGVTALVLDLPEEQETLVVDLHEEISPY